METVKTGTFLTFMVTFAYARLYLFGYRFVFGDCLTTLGSNTSPSIVFMWLGMAALSVMHVYWFSLIIIIKMIYNMLMSGGVLEDARERTIKTCSTFFTQTTRVQTLLACLSNPLCSFRVRGPPPRTR